MSEQTQDLNGWQNIGKVSMWVEGKLTGNEHTVYMAIVHKTVGYCQYTSKELSYERLSKLTNITKRTIASVVPKLLDKGFILKVATNKMVTFEGKIPYKYQLAMMLPNFPSLGKLRKSATVVPRPPENIRSIDELIIWDLDKQVTTASNKTIIKARNNTQRSLTEEEYVVYLTSQISTENSVAITTYIAELLKYMKEV